MAAEAPQACPGATVTGFRSLSFDPRRGNTLFLHKASLLNDTPKAARALPDDFKKACSHDGNRLSGSVGGVVSVRCASVSCLTNEHSGLFCSGRLEETSSLCRRGWRLAKFLNEPFDLRDANLPTLIQHFIIKRGLGLSPKPQTLDPKCC